MAYQFSAVCFSRLGKGQTISEDQIYLNGRILPAEHTGIDNFRDAQFTSDDLAAVAVLDGVSEAGHTAAPLSDAAVEGLTEALRALSLNDKLDTELFQRMLQVLNRLVNRRKETLALQNAGVGLVCLAIEENQLYLSCLGDAVAYCQRQGMVRRLNDPQPGYLSKLPAQYLGLDERLTLDPRVLHGALMDGDLFMLCSGNLSTIPEETISDLMLTNQSMIAKGRALLALAEEQGLEDDLTVLLVRAEETDTVHPFKEVPLVTDMETPTEVLEEAPNPAPKAQKPQPVAEEPALEPLEEEENNSFDSFGEETDDPESMADMSLYSVARRWAGQTGRKKLLSVLFALVLVGAIVFGVYSYGEPIKEQFQAWVNPGVEVPSVTGMTKEQAQEAVEEAGFTLVSGEGMYSETAKAGTVLSQQPEADTKAKEGSSITVVLSLGAEVAMPQVLGMTKEEALDAIAAVDEEIVVEFAEEAVYSEQYNKDTVCAQSVEAQASLYDAEKIVLTLSKGSQYVALPDFTAMTGKEAQAFAKDNQLNMEVTEEYSDTVKKGSVIAQDQQENTKLKRGETISITVSKGKKDTKVEVPIVQGLWQSEAEEKLKAAGFKYYITTGSDSSMEYGRVLYQSDVGKVSTDQEIGICVNVAKTQQSSSSSSGSSSSGSSSSGNNIQYVG